MRFDELDLEDEILDGLYDMNFQEMTPVQEATIPIILEGRDIIGCAQTGTGKTAAYLLPVIDRISSVEHDSDAIRCVVMSPTRELAQQIDRQMQGFGYFLPISSVAVYGGTDGATFAQQKRGLKMGADVVIATPGRLLDHLKMNYVDLSQVETFILDEADRMLDMGFYDDIMQIVRRLPKERQTLMFSATMPPKTRSLAKEILTDPAEISIAVSRPTEKIDQSAYVCYQGQKTPLLINLFKTRHSHRVIVFAASKLKVKDLTRELRRERFKAAEMHSDLDQNKREEVMNEFRAGKIDILVATDIVARGIDIDDIAMVVNYDVPREAEDYVHRIGRTARANADGMAVTLVSDLDQMRFGRIERFLGYEVKKGEIPAELGEAPAYRPDRRSPGGAGRNAGGSRQGAGRQGAQGNKERGRGRKDRSPRRDNNRPNSENRRQQPQQQEPQSQQPGPAKDNGAAQTQGTEPNTPRRDNRRRGGFNRRKRRPDGGSKPAAPQAPAPTSQE